MTDFRAVLLLSTLLIALTGQAQRYEFSRPLMGMSFRIVVYAQDSAKAKQASKAAFDRVVVLNRIMSDYEPNSELNKLSDLAGNGQAVPVSPELFRVLDRAQALAVLTGGAFDVTAGASIQLWRRARQLKRLPAQYALDEALKTVGFRTLKLDAENRTVKLTQTGTRLDLGGIAKGYVLDEAIAVLKKHGLRRALVSAGGDIVAGDAPPGKAGWRVALIGLEDDAKPQLLRLANGAVATSGDLYQFLEVDGTRYSHIVDPRSGSALTEQRLVHVLAMDAMSADSLSTAISVLGPKGGLLLVAADKNLGARVVFREALDQVRVIESPVFRAWPKAKN